MLTVVASLIPVFLLIALGYALRRILLKQDAYWVGLEQLVYYVLFPALLIETLGRADLASVPIAGVGGAMLLSVLIMGALCLALRPLLARRLALSGPSFTSLFQGATRWQTFVALSVVGNMLGNAGLAVASVAMVAMIPVLNVMSVSVLARFASPHKTSSRATALAIAKNPFIWGCLIGIVINIARLPIPTPLYDFAGSLGRSSLAIGLLVVGAGLQLDGLKRPNAAAALTVALKLVAMPVIAIALGRGFGLSGDNLVVVACCASVPSASNAYVLARQMGGDAPLLAQILVLQTVAAAFTMPLFIALAG